MTKERLISAGNPLYKKYKNFCDIFVADRSYRGEEESKEMDRSDIVFEQYYEDVFRFLRGLSADEHLAEELTQETFYRAWKSLDSYRGIRSCVFGCVLLRRTCTTHSIRSRSGLYQGRIWRSILRRIRTFSISSRIVRRRFRYIGFFIIYRSHTRRYFPSEFLENCLLRTSERSSERISIGHV